MAGSALTTLASLSCPHGGTVGIVSANTCSIAASAPLALSTDTYTITGCPFQIPVGPIMVPSPCVTVLWLLTDMRNGINGARSLSMSSVGLCLAATQLPQGPVVIGASQPTVSSE